MRVNKKITWSLISILIITLAAGAIALADAWQYSMFKGAMNGYRYNTVNGYMWNNGYNGMSGMMNMMGAPRMMAMPNVFSNNIDNMNEKMPLDEIKKNINNYLKSYDKNLEIGDIFVFTDTEYYVSVEEKDTGKGAMELLVNPYTGYIYPEPGPNMMWNEKYGMHAQFGFGMMGSGMWNYSNRNFNMQNIKKIDRNRAIKIADEYVKSFMNKDFSVANEGHEFYGYYTFHVNKDNQTVGMLSVNYYTGDVWYHTWHGQLDKIISVHEEK
ncbi:hypothetical protein [Caloranaerobacter sp. TR13]|uniref:hypothetical protein n=1 Tax=Caloranaerobacter sp. TR13 TaxID=1302151 RepID=UPI0006D4528E|nr:hypothetical protein [Caloranaerobacter sp. TR13]